MKLQNSTACAMGLAVALTLGAASPSMAQSDSTRAKSDTTVRSKTTVKKTTHRTTSSSTRIPIKKETSGGEVAPTPQPAPTPAPKPDTAVSTTTTTVDSTVVKTDTAVTVTAVTPPPAPAPVVAPDTGFRPRSTMTNYGNRMFGTSGFYVGVGGGTSSPISDMKNIGYDNGWNVSVPIGWESNSMRFPVGVRFTGAYNRLNGATSTDLNSGLGSTSSPTTITNPNANLLSGTADLTVKFPFNEARSASLYLLGGGGVNWFRNVQGTALGMRLGNESLNGSIDNTGNNNFTKFSANAGAGLELGGGPVAFFVESRWVNLFTPGRDLRYVPVIAGITIR